jgi:nucleoside-diphosphate-sugar epimerase
MKIAITGATGFVGRHLLAELCNDEYRLRCWYRPHSDRGGLETIAPHVEWVEGSLGQVEAAESLVDGCDALVHAALERPPQVRMAGKEFTPEMALHNIEGSLQLFAAARKAGVKRIVFVSSCAVYGEILSDRPLDELHPLWPDSHYGAHKAALEAFVHSYARSEDYPICALRPTGIFGLANPVSKSKWYDLVADVVGGRPVTCRSGGKEVYVGDVARAIRLLLTADEARIAGQAFNCYDLYVSQYDVVQRAMGLSGVQVQIDGGPTQPKHQIDSGKLRSLGFEFGGPANLDATIRHLIAAIRTTGSVRL